MVFSLFWVLGFGCQGPQKQPPAALEVEMQMMKPGDKPGKWMGKKVQVKGVAHRQKPVGAKTILWLERHPSGKGMCHVEEVKSRVWLLLPMA